MLRHHLVCCMLSLGTATFKHSSSRPISRKHSRAAMLVMCALGVSAVLGVDAIIIPFNPGRRSTSSSGGQGQFLPFCARKHARAAPAGPAPTIKRSVSTDNRSILQHSWRLAIVLNLCIGSKSSRIQAWRRDWKHQGGRQQKQEICQWQIISTMLKDGQVTGFT